MQAVQETADLLRAQDQLQSNAGQGLWNCQIWATSDKRGASRLQQPVPELREVLHLISALASKKLDRFGLVPKAFLWPDRPIQTS